MNKLYSLAFSAMIAVGLPAAAEGPSDVAANFPDSRTLTVQRKVDALFERGEFERAFFIYRNELVPAGDKYAQYMVGYMSLMGMGTQEDAAAAFAWYRLAAERGTPEFAAVRDQLRDDLGTQERLRSDAVYRQLRRQFSDLAILLASIKHDHRELSTRSGSRLPGRSTPMTVVDRRSPVIVRSGADYYGRVRRQLQQSLVTLAELGGFPDLETDPDRVDIDELERLVRQRIESTPD